jgi:Cu(I)/Ag(I) efflux system membrane fusion protein
MKYIILLIFLSSVFLFSKPIETKQLFNRKTVKVKSQNIAVTKSFYATTKIDETRITDISLRFDGYIGKLFADKNYKYVKKRTALFNVYSKEVALAIGELKVSQTMGASKDMQMSAKRKLSLLGISRGAINGILKNRNIDEYINIYSPATGYVMNKSVNNKSFVKSGTRVMQIADISKLWVIARVYQNDVAFIKKGMDATVDIDGFKSIKSKVDFIYPKANNKDKTINVRLVIKNSRFKIFPNLFAKVNFHTKPKKILTLPKSAILSKGDEKYVFMPDGDDGSFSPQKIEAVRISSSKYEILKGLKDGDTVIDKALFMLDSDALTNNLYEDEDW